MKLIWLIFLLVIIGCETQEQITTLTENEDDPRYQKYHPDFINIVVLGHEKINGTLILTQNKTINFFDFDLREQTSQIIRSPIKKNNISIYYLPPPLRRSDVYYQDDQEYINATLLGNATIISEKNFDHFLKNDEPILYICMNLKGIQYISLSTNFHDGLEERRCQREWENRGRQISDSFFKTKYTSQLYTPLLIECFSSIRTMEREDSVRSLGGYMYLDPKSNSVTTMLKQCRDFIETDEHIRKKSSWSKLAYGETK